MQIVIYYYTTKMVTNLQHFLNISKNRTKSLTIITRSVVTLS